MKVIGHRGARGLAPENTAAAIARGLACGVDEVEIDIRITSDGVPILGHDPTIRTSDGDYIIAGHTLAGLRQKKPDITTLSEALQLMKGRAALYVEVKHAEPVQPVVDVIQDYLKSTKKPTAILLGSKSQKTLRELHSKLPQIPKIVIEPWSGIWARHRAKQVATRRISMRSWWLWRGFLRAMQKQGYEISPYTMNDPLKTAKWEPYIYGVVTDYPDRFKK